VEETRGNHRPVASHWQTFSHNVCIEYTSPWMGFKLTTLVVIGTDCTGSFKSNYHTITTTPEIIVIRWLQSDINIVHRYKGKMTESDNWPLISNWLIWIVSSGQVWFRFRVSNATFKNISWLSFVLAEEIVVPGEKHPPVVSHWQTLSHNVVSPECDLTLVVIGNDSYITVTRRLLIGKQGGCFVNAALFL
jgi:hypothetical protein